MYLARIADVRWQVYCKNIHLCLLLLCISLLCRVQALKSQFVALVCAIKKEAGRRWCTFKFTKSYRLWCGNASGVFYIINPCHCVVYSNSNLYFCIANLNNERLKHLLFVSEKSFLRLGACVFLLSRSGGWGACYGSNRSFAGQKYGGGYCDVERFGK